MGDVENLGSEQTDPEELSSCGREYFISMPPMAKFFRVTKPGKSASPPEGDLVDNSGFSRVHQPYNELLMAADIRC